MLERMENSLRIDIKNFNGYNFEIWMIKMEYLLVYQE